MAENGELFLGIDQPITRGVIVPRLLRLRGRVPSFYTFFKDTIYLETWIKALRLLLLPKEPFNRRSDRRAGGRPVVTFRSSFFHIYKDLNQNSGQVRIQTANQRFRLARGRV
jgi:hypothetical protein